MPVETTVSRVQYATNGTTGPWSIPFYFLQNADVRVVYADSSGNETLLVLTTNYTLTGAGVTAGGSATTVTAYAAGGTITIRRDLDALQPEQFSDGDPFPAAAANRGLDRGTMLAQQALEIAGRAIVFPESDNASGALGSAAARANKTLAFDSAGNATVLVPVSGSAADVLTQLANAVSLSLGAGQVGLGLSLAYAASTVGWGVRIAHSDAYNGLRDVPVAQWAALLTGTSTDDHTAPFLAAVAASKAANQALFLPAGRWNITPTAVIEHSCIFGAGPTLTKVYVDASAYAIGSVVFRNTGDTWSGLQIREKNLSKTRAIMMQLSAATALNAVGGSLTFTGYTDLDRVWVFGGLIAIDVGNVFTATLRGCRGCDAGTGLNGTPADDAGDNGYFNTLLALGCEFADNNKNCNLDPAGSQAHSVQLIGGSIERALTTKSLFRNIYGLRFIGTYQEQTVAITTITITSCTSVYAQFDITGSNCDLELGTNTEISIDGWQSGTGHLIGGDGTQKVTLINSVFPASGNSARTAFARFTAINTDYNGDVFDLTADGLIVTQGTFNRAKAVVNNNAANYTVAAGISKVLFTGTQAASVLFTFPAAAAALDGFEIHIYTQAAVGTASTWASSGATFVGAPATLAAGSTTRFIYHHATTNWLPA